ncbi:MAG: hypothetical protein LBT50_11615 [Prevotellaceae bacterium]|nr:hypothetical protein [Prevotellaceae bacterium]
MSSPDFATIGFPSFGGVPEGRGGLLLIHFTIKRIPRHAQPPPPSDTPPKEGNLEDVKVIPSATSFSLLAPLAERLFAMTCRWLDCERDAACHVSTMPNRLGFHSVSK